MIRTTNYSRVQDKIWFFLLGAYIVAGYLSADVLLPDIANTVILYAFLVYSALAIVCSGRIKWTPIVIWEIVCLVLAFVAMLYSPETSFTGTFYSLFVNVVLVIILAQMPWNEARFNKIMNTFVASAVAMILILAMTDKLGDGSDRLGEDIMGNANILATMLMVSAVYGVWVFVSANERKKKIAIVVALVIIYIGMFLSGGRKYIVVPILSMYILLINKADRKGRKHPVKNTAIICVVVFVVYQAIMNIPFFYDIIGYRFEGVFALFGGDGEVDSSTAKRLQMIEAGWARFLESPFLGYGFDSFKYYNAESVTGYKYYSHNNFIELLYNQGLVGFIGYYAFYVYLLAEASKRHISELNKGFVWAVVLSLLFFEYFGITYSITPVQFMLFFTVYRLKNGNQAAPRAG